MTTSSLLLLIVGVAVALGFGFVAGVLFSASIVQFGSDERREGFSAGQAQERTLAEARAEGRREALQDAPPSPALADVNAVRHRSAS